MTNLEQQIEAIMLRLDKVEAAITGRGEVGKDVEQPKPKFDSFYVDCTREEYPEVKAILEAQGYEPHNSQTWSHLEDCVTVQEMGHFFPFWLKERDTTRPVYTLAQLREKYGEQPRPKTRIEWLQELPDGYRERALANCVEWERWKPTDECVSITKAIWGMCGWGKTPEGGDFWLSVWSHYHNGTPLPPLPDEPKKYEAGFWWNNVTNLNLPDGSYLHFGIVSGVWQKFVRNTPRPARPHTLTPVEKHTVGKFYAIKGAADSRLNDYRNYALCVGEGQFVGAIDDWNFIVVGCVPPRNVTLNEVTPL